MTDLTPEPVGDVPAAAEHDETEPTASLAATLDEPAAPIDLDAIERDLAGVERALERLSDGTYWTDEVSGEAIPDHVLTNDPTARRA